ncbi:hypothetical protein, partial [Streptomyces sp. NPDC002403]
MTFQNHLRTFATRAPSPTPTAEAKDIYVISFFIDNERDDPQQPTLTSGYTEAQFHRTIADASDEAEAHWNYAFWLQNKLTAIGDLTQDPDGTTARHRWISELGLWHDNQHTHPEDCMTTMGPIAALIEANFNQACVQHARDLHDDGVIENMTGRPVPPRAGVLRRDRSPNRSDNPPGLADDFTAWVRTGRGIQAVPIPDSTI